MKREAFPLAARKDTHPLEADSQPQLLWPLFLGHLLHIEQICAIPNVTGVCDRARVSVNILRVKMMRASIAKRGKKKTNAKPHAQLVLVAVDSFAHEQCAAC
jgi:hypothetical protein